jgi:hypothetical protein
MQCYVAGDLSLNWGEPRLMCAAQPGSCTKHENLSSDKITPIMDIFFTHSPLYFARGYQCIRFVQNKAQEVRAAL